MYVIPFPSCLIVTCNLWVCGNHTSLFTVTAYPTFMRACVNFDQTETPMKKILLGPHTIHDLMSP